MKLLNILKRKFKAPSTFSVHDERWSIGSHDEPGPPDVLNPEAILPF